MARKPSDFFPVCLSVLSFFLRAQHDRELNQGLVAARANVKRLLMVAQKNLASFCETPGLTVEQIKEKCLAQLDKAEAAKAMVRDWERKSEEGPTEKRFDEKLQADHVLSFLFVVGSTCQEAENCSCPHC